MTRENLKSLLSCLPFELGSRVILPFALVLDRCWSTVKWKFIYKLPFYARLCFYLNLVKLVFCPSKGCNRLLGIYDFKTCPWSVGDPLVFVETLNCLRLEHGFEEVDVAVVYEQDRPSGIRPKVNLDRENAFDYILDWLPLFSTCHNLGSLFHFKSRQEMNRFLKNCHDRYVFFPPLRDHLGETFNYSSHADLGKIVEFHKKHGYIPHLRIGSINTAWAYHFFISMLGTDGVPVVLSVKRTEHDQQRNPDVEVWAEFISRCWHLHPEITFFLVGLRGEEPSRFRELPNVIVVKDFGTTILEDLALIQKSLIYVATSSGPNVAALFSNTAYLIFQQPVEQKSTHLGKNDNYCFANPNQRLYDTSCSLDADFILNEFIKVYSGLNKNEWRGTAIKSAKPKHGHPSARISMNKQSSVKNDST